MSDVRCPMSDSLSLCRVVPWGIGRLGGMRQAFVKTKENLIGHRTSDIGHRRVGGTSKLQEFLTRCATFLALLPITDQDREWVSVDDDGGRPWIEPR
jgi:hypothetical protein